MIPSSINAIPNVASTVIVTWAPRTCRITSTYTSQPRPNITTITIGMDSSGSRPRLRHRVKVRNAASTAKAPWARLITRMTPKIRVRPDAISA